VANGVNADIVRSGEGMSSTNLQLRFDGPELRAHEMDVTLLAPSLLAFGELCKEANRVLNGEDAKVRVLLSADVKANCVTIDLSIVQTIWETTKTFITRENVASAKEPLEWIGIITAGTQSVSGLVAYLVWKKKRNVTEVTQSDDGNSVTVRVEGDNNTVTIAAPIYKLSKNAKVVESLKSVTSPVSEANGINEAVFIHARKRQLQIDEKTAQTLQESVADSDQEVEPQTFTAHIVVYGPVLDPKARKWRFRLGNKVEYIDISESDIAKQTLERGSIAVGDTYKVRLEMIERKTSTGGFTAEYKVKEVISFMPGHRERQEKLL
jgi:hypothetical protein